MVWVPYFVGMVRILARYVGLLTLLSGIGFLTHASSAAETNRYFGIRVVDRVTQRGVPLVRLTTVSKVRYYTDSGGWVAFDEPGMMDQDVFFEVWSHGYQYPKDGFGSQGVVLKTVAGELATIEIDRVNLAERLYRVTGAGRYRDSWLLGQEVPSNQPLLNGQVVGQDTVQATVYQGKVYWFWGDTNRPRYPLGHFKTAGATSLLPSAGGLNPLVGIDLEYFVDEDGFSSRMTPVEGPGAVWLHGLFNLRDEGKQALYGHYSRVKSLGEQYEHGLLAFEDASETFVKAERFADDAMLYPRGQALCYEHTIQDYVYFCRPFPSVRVRADREAFGSSENYEAYTCLQVGARYDADAPKIARDANGDVSWAWRRDTDYIDARRMHTLIQGGLVKADDAPLVLRSKGDLVYVDSGSVHWNEFRQKWVMIAGQLGGEHSFLGDIWYAEADQLEGPWVNANRVISHEGYSFYNPAHHRFLDQDGGRVILFDGTYASTFAKTKVPTPRYDYNQLMYSLDLGGDWLSGD